MRRTALTWAAGVMAVLASPVGVSAGTVAAGRSSPSESGPRDAALPTLERRPVPGVRLLMRPDPSAEGLASCVVLPAGTRSEGARELGLAALVHAYVAEQTPGLSTSEASRMLTSRGATLTNALGRDTVSFCVSLPSRELPLALWLAGRRLSAPTPTSEAVSTAAKSARDAAARALTESPGLAGSTRLEELVFQGYSGMQATPLSGALLLDTAAEPGATAFFTRNYRESTAVITLVGRFDPAEAERLARGQLATLEPRQPRPPPPQVPEGAPQRSGRYAFVMHDRAANVELYFGWVAPEPGTKEYDALLLASATLALGDGSRLSERLVRKTHWATTVEAWLDQSRGPTLFGLHVALGKRVDLDAVAKIVAEELQKLATSPPKAEELRRATSLIQEGSMRRLRTVEERARHLGDWAVASGEPNPFQVPPDGLGAVSPAEVSETVRRHLGTYGCSLVEVYPKNYPIEPSAAPMKRFYLVKGGDTLIGIARAHGIPLEALLGANGIVRKSPIFPGQKLVIPSGGKAPPKTETHAVRKGDTLSGIAKRHGVSVANLARANGISKKRPIFIGQTLVIPPKPAK